MAQFAACEQPGMAGLVADEIREHRAVLRNLRLGRRQRRIEFGNAGEAALRRALLQPVGIDAHPRLFDRALQLRGLGRVGVRQLHAAFEP